MTSFLSYAHNRELFTHFYALQARFTACLASRPGLVRAWLEAQRRRDPERSEASGAARSWRTARLSSARRRELGALIEGAAASSLGSAALAEWLLVAVPVRTYFEIAAPGGLPDPAAEDCQRQLAALRDTLFATNYGLAKAAARRRRLEDYEDMLSAASSGRLDAIDRYVPGAKAARFAHFAGFWIRYHVSRRAQKNASVISFPVNQHRIGRRIQRYLRGREGAGAAPTPAQLCAELGLGPWAFYWQRSRPTVISLHAPPGAGEEGLPMEQCLCDPAPPPAAQAEENEIAEALRAVLRRRVDPATRLMLAYLHQVGLLGDAAEDYLAGLEAEGLAAIRGARPMRRHRIPPIAAAPAGG
jgi:DNA-directed RNA polymerase specialized sigma subunit